MPESIKGLSARPYADEFQKSPTPSWKKHVLITKEGTPNVSLIRASPALVRFELDILLKSIAELKLGEGNTTDLLFVNFKSSDYCGHLLGFESDECGDVVAEIDNALKTVITHLEKVTQHELLTVLTADHGASPLPELTGGVRLSRGKLHRQLNERFKATPSHFDVVPFMTNSQIWLHKGELKRAGYRVTDVIKFLKTYEAELKHPENTRADYWLKHGKKAKSPFFHSVVSRDELKS